MFIDHSEHNFVLFESVNALRNALVRDWVSLSQDQKNELRQYLFQITIVRYGSIPAYVREKILQVTKVVCIFT